MKRSVIVISPVAGAMECECTGMLEFETAGAPTAGADGCWGFPEGCPVGVVDCPEGTEGAAGCAVEPVGAGVNPMLAAIEAEYSADGGLEEV
jgi:hypothetical protein